MLSKKWIGMALLAAAAVSTNAMADNRGVNTALGAVAGAVVGNVVGGQNGALIGGVLGAVVGASVSDHDRRDRYYDGRRYSNVRYQAPVYARPAPVYVRPGYRDGYYRDTRRVEYVRDGRGYYRY